MEPGESDFCMQPQLARLRFFLGGQDLEMVAIRELLERQTPAQFEDDHLPWGAKASAYRERIEQTLATGRIVVLVELLDDLGLLERAGQGGTLGDCNSSAAPGAETPSVISVDHHGELAGHDRPTALEQVFQLLQLPQSTWTRRLELIAANDRGHVRGMLEHNATLEELHAIRAADRAAQGITGDEEAAGRQAAARAELMFDGRLTLVRLPHARTATVTDVLDRELGGPGYEHLLVICPGSVMFYGNGAAIEALRRVFSQGFYGGQLPERGFWGHPTAIVPQELLSVLRAAILS